MVVPDGSRERFRPPFETTLPQLLAHAVAQFGDREFLVCGDRRVTFRQADEESARLACGLLRMGASKGTRIGIVMPNSPDWVLVWLAAARIGALTVPISTFYQAGELAWVLGHSDVETLLMVDRYLKNDYVARMETVPGLAGQTSQDLALADLPYLRHVLVWGDTPAWAEKGPDELHRLAAADARFDRALLESVESRVTPADELMIIYTSGSTSEPKAVVHTHDSVIGLCYALEASGWGDVRHGDRIYPGMPFFWIGGHNINLIPAMFRGACLVMTATPDPDDVIDTCIREEVTSISAWPPQIRAIQERAAAREVTFSHLRHRLVQRDRDGELIPLELIPGALGMTETFGPHGLEPQGTRLPADLARAYGRTLPGIERRIVDPATGQECPPGTAGELYVRGFSLMRGFYKRLREDTFDRDGFYPTGDRCRIDADGWLFFEGRFGEMIKTSGANVSPREVEAALERFDEVREAAVFGIPDAQRDELIVAVVVPAAGARIDPPVLIERLGSELSHYKVPRLVIPMDYDAIPRTDAAKVKKQLLRELVLAERKGSDDQGLAPVDDQERSVDVGGRRGEQEQDDRAHVLGAPRPT
jgi:acyl-coenzyme A synthetase/AMP-(fatty) acid ligase